MNELIDYFVKLGYPPDVAAKMATKVGAMTHPEAPIANGVKLDPTTGVAQLLTNKYGMNPQQAASYAGQVMSGAAFGSSKILAEAEDLNRAPKPGVDVTVGPVKKLPPPGVDLKIGAISRYIPRLHMEQGPVKLLPPDLSNFQLSPEDQAFSDKDAAYTRERKKYLHDTDPEETGSSYRDSVKRWWALQDSTAASDYRDKLNAYAKLGPPGPNAYPQPATPLPPNLGLKRR